MAGLFYHMKWGTVEEGCKNIRTAIDKIYSDKQEKRLFLLFSLYREWCEKSNRTDVTLGLEVDGRGRMDFWDDLHLEWNAVVQWSTIEEGCQKLRAALD